MAEDTARLYVGSLPYIAQKADVEKLFIDNDVPFKKVDISIDPFNGRNPSYCFVDFESSLDATRAMEVLQGQTIHGRPIKINPTTERRSNTSRPPTKVYDRGWKAREMPTADAGPDAFVYDRWNRDDAPSRWTAPQEDGRRLYVGGLPQIPNQDAVNAEMRVLFQGYNIEAVSKIISPHHSTNTKPGSHHYCFVDLPTAEDAEAAVNALNGTPTPYGGQYRVSRARTRNPTKVEREQLGVSGKPRVARSKSPPRRDLSGSWRRKD